jgi:uncharacterized protein YpiB (UPF0302 family)
MLSTKDYENERVGYKKTHPKKIHLVEGIINKTTRERTFYIATHTSHFGGFAFDTYFVLPNKRSIVRNNDG